MPHRIPGLARRRRHTVLKRTNVIVVERHGLIVASGGGLLSHVVDLRVLVDVEDPVDQPHVVLLMRDSIRGYRDRLKFQLREPRENLGAIGGKIELQAYRLTPGCLEAHRQWPFTAHGKVHQQG